VKEMFMKVADLLTPDRILAPLVAPSLQGGLDAILQRLEASGPLRPDASTSLAASVAGGETGEAIRAHPGILVVAARTDRVDDLAMGLLVSPLAIPADPLLPGEEFRAILLLLTPRRLSTLRVQAIPTLLRLLRDEDRATRLLAAEGPDNILALRGLMETELHERLLVEDAMTPAGFRVYPETPLPEVLDLMVRRGLPAIPVVGPTFQVVGVITAGDALRHLLPQRVQGDGEEGGVRTDALTARDLMSRSVMCVSEDQSLLEAAHLMVKRDVAQIPVIRDGEFVGFLTRDAVLLKLAEM
jgi:CBS domain-containing protein